MPVKAQPKKQPKAKADFIQELTQLTSLSPAVMEEMTVEKLRLIYKSVKPVTKKVFPANWKRFNKAALLDLFLEHSLPSDKSYLEWDRDRTVAELEYLQSELQQETVVERDPNAPLCPSCQVPMMPRVNRASLEKFWGRMAFPMRKGTMAWTYAGKSAAKAQAYHQGQKTVQFDSNEEMDGRAARRAQRVPVPSEAGESWDAVSELTQEENEMIAELRENKNQSEKS